MRFSVLNLETDEFVPLTMLHKADFDYLYELADCARFVGRTIDVPITVEIVSTVPSTSMIGTDNIAINGELLKMRSPVDLDPIEWDSMRQTYDGTWIFEFFRSTLLRIQD